MNYIIGIAGNKNSGKDTIASMLNYIAAVGVTKANYIDYVLKRCNYDETYKDRIVHYADKLKDIVSIIFGIRRHVLDDRDYKDFYYYCLETEDFAEPTTAEKEDKNIVITMDKLRDNSFSFLLNTNTNKFHYVKIRTLLQYVGTEVFRKEFGEDVWIKIAMRDIVNIAKARRVCIVPDVRFSNEADAIHKTDKSLYGQVIIVRRKSDNKDNHTSENVNVTADYEINNDSTLANLFYKVLNVAETIINKPKNV